MATIGGRSPSRETALAMIAQVERQAAAIARRYANDDAVLDRFSDFRTFIDQLAEFHLFVDMVDNRLGAFEPDARAAQVRKLAVIRWRLLEMELEVSSLFLDRMVTGGKPWPMGSQKFLRRRLTRLDDIAAFHTAHGAAYELTPPSAALMQNVRDRVDAQIDNSMPLADFGTAPPPAPASVDEAPSEIPEPPPPEEPVAEIAPAPEPEPVAPPPAPPPAPLPPQPDVMIPGMMSFTPTVSKPATSSSGPAAAPIPKPPAAVPVMPDFVIPGMMLPEAPPPPPPPPPAPPVQSVPAPPSPSPSPSPRPVSELPPVPPLEGEDFGEDYVSQKARAVAQLAEKAAAKPPAGKKPPPQGMARRDFRLKVRDEADGYKYIEGNGLAVITEVCRIANITIDELAKTLELSRPGLVLILNGRDPVSTELLKTLRRLVLRTGGLS